MKRNLWLSFLFTVAMIIVMRWQGSSLITPQSPIGIIDLEFAKTAERFRQLHFFWDTKVVLRNIYFDFLLILAYVWFLATACIAVKNKWSHFFQGLALSAGAFDVLENFLMIMVLIGRFNLSTLQIIYYCAAVKFILAALVLIYLLLSLFGLFKTKPVG